MNAKTSIGRRVAAAVGALAVGIAGLALSATAANASVSDIDGNARGSITVHKYAGDPSSTQNKAGSRDGRKLSDADAANLGKTLSGVQFTLQEVRNADGSPIDLSTAAGWAQAKQAQQAFRADGTVPGFTIVGTDSANNGTATTDANGTATFPNLGLRLYLVSEGNDTGNNNILTKAAPFLVTVPYPSKGNSNNNGTGDDTWIYDVHAYPKNEIADKPVKSVADPGTGVAVGDTVDWTIKLPLNSTGGAYTKVQINDQLDPTLKFDTKKMDVYLGDSVDPANALDRKDNICAPEANFQMGDYCALPKGGVELVGPNVSITLSPTGLAKLNAANPKPKYFIVVLHTTVASLKNGAIGQVPNQASTVTNTGSGDVTQNTNVVGVNYGSIKVTKKGAAAGNTLAGAQFVLCAADVNSQEGGNKLVAKTQDGTQSAKDCDNSKVYTTDSNGNFQIDGIWVGITDANQSLDQYSRDYFLKEITAPAGYVLPDNPYTIVNVNRNNANSAALPYTITNTQNQGPNLPLTGAAGTALLVGMGALLVIGGGASAAVARKRRAEANR